MINQLYAHFIKHPIICTDTRLVYQGAIFFALKGDNFNGNQFAQRALDAGCSLAVIDELEYKTNDNTLLVNNVLTTLQELANHHRKQLRTPIISITGSNGKTTSKELIHAVLSRKYNVISTKGNLNNHIGVPLTLLEMRKHHELAIVEMGANHQGEIKQLCNIAEPNFGLITNIGKAHLEGFGGYEGVIKTKKELYDFIKKTNGKLFVNDDNELLKNLSETIARITYGTSSSVDFIGKLIECNPFVKLKFKAEKSPENIDSATIVSTQLIGNYNFENILAAACIGHYFGVSEEEIKIGLENYVSNNNRSQVMQTANNFLVLDAYNANPSSMKAAIENFAQLNKSNKMVILGDMLELGKESKEEHKAIVELLKTKSISCAFLVGNNFSVVSTDTNATSFSSSEDLAIYLKAHPIKRATILIKGSRGIKLERVVELL